MAPPPGRLGDNAKSNPPKTELLATLLKPAVLSAFPISADGNSVLPAAQDKIFGVTLDASLPLNPTSENSAAVFKIHPKCDSLEQS